MEDALKTQRSMSTSSVQRGLKRRTKPKKRVLKKLKVEEKEPDPLKNMNVRNMLLMMKKKEEGTKKEVQSLDNASKAALKTRNNLTVEKTRTVTDLTVVDGRGRGRVESKNVTVLL